MSLVFSNKNARDFGQKWSENEKVSQNSRVAKKKSPERVDAAKVATRNRGASFGTSCPKIGDRIGAARVNNGQQANHKPTTECISPTTDQKNPSPACRFSARPFDALVKAGNRNLDKRKVP
jgi:hypothetical protein